MIPKLYLLRHGPTEWNLQGRMQGSLDSPLTALGRAQAEAQARILAAQPDIAQFSARVSPQGRARQTAEIALAPMGAPPAVDPRLREIGTGTWEGRTIAEIRAETPGAIDPDLSELARYSGAPGGEGGAGVQERLRALLADLTGPTVIVSHGITLTYLRGMLGNLTAQERDQLERPQGVVIAWENGAEHLLGEAVSAV